MWYSAGTVAVTANSATVTGTGTQFSSNVRVGDAFIAPDGRLYEVSNVASSTVISIKPNYQGSTASGQAYAVAPMLGYDKDLSDRFNLIANQWGTQLSSLRPWATAATADIALSNLGGSQTGTKVFKGSPADGRTALELGNAATRAVQTSPTDTTAGALMAVGAFGLGSLALQTLTDPYSAPATGFYRLNNSTGMPDLTTWSLQHVSRDSATGRAAQKAWSDVGGGAEWRRIRTGAGVWQPWHKQFDTGNILGTVSQSGGVPTGAIIERGSNANGSYVRLADGTQECWTNKTATVPVGGVVGFSFTNAATFFGEVPALFTSVSPESFTLEIVWGMEAHSATGATVYVQNKGTADRNVAVFFRAIGRWY